MGSKARVIIDQVDNASPSFEARLEVSLLKVS